MTKIGKKFVLSVAALVMGVTSGMAQAKASKQLNIWNWSDYIADDTLEQFEKQTGIRPVYDVFDNNDVVKAKLQTGHTGYDLVVPSAFSTAVLIQTGKFKKLDREKIPNLKNLDPNLMKLLEGIDPGNQYLVPWGLGTNGLGVNIERVQKRLGEDVALNDWSLLFDPEKASKLEDCGISMLDEPSQVVPAILHYIGRDPNSRDEKDIRDAFKALRKIRPYIRQFTSSSYINDLATGDLCLVYGYSGDITISADRAKEARTPYTITYLLPKTGAPIWFDTMAIPSDAPNPDNAMKFINFIETPEVHAAITNAVFFPSANQLSREFVLPEIKENENIYPKEEMFKKLFFIRPMDTKTARLESYLWSEFKVGRWFDEE